METTQQKRIDQLFSDLVWAIKMDNEIEKEKYNKEIKETYARQKYAQFEISVGYWDKSFTRVHFDTFPMEGIVNALIIYNQYVKIGFKLNLHSISIMEIGVPSIVKKTNFKYS